MTSQQRRTAREQQKTVAWRAAQERTEFVKKKWREAEAQGSDAVRLLERGRPATRFQAAVEPLETVEEATAVRVLSGGSLCRF